MISVIKSKFMGDDQEGDFAWMIEQPQYARTLFIFNDNEGEFYAHFNGGQHTCTAGGGNASIRHYQCSPDFRATGIPTGTYDKGPHYKGYSSLDAQVLKAIADSMAQLDSLLKTGRFDSVAFSWSDKTNLGGKIFKTAQIVRDYIVEQIYAVAERN